MLLRALIGWLKEGDNTAVECLYIGYDGVASQNANEEASKSGKFRLIKEATGFTFRPLPDKTLVLPGAPKPAAPLKANQLPERIGKPTVTDQELAKSAEARKPAKSAITKK